MKCTLHADKPAIGNCHACGKPFCSDCLKQSGDVYLCPGCYSAAHAPPKTPVPAAPQSVPAPGAGPATETLADPVTGEKAIAVFQMVHWNDLGGNEYGMLVFTRHRAILARLSNSGIIGGVLLGQVGSTAVAAVSGGVKGSELSQKTPAELLADNKKNVSIEYKDITKIKLVKSIFPDGVLIKAPGKIINVNTDKHDRAIMDTARSLVAAARPDLRL
jgi:hypothetical protein